MALTIDMDIINKVAQSGLLELNLEDFYPEGERAAIDIKPLLFHGLVLKEKDFREHIANEDWEKYTSQYVSVFCSSDAIVPTWAYMLISASLEPYAKKIVFGTPETLEAILFHEQLQKINIEQYREKRIVIKGCSDKKVPVSAYVEITAILKPIVKSIMYGEPCSTVPVYKRK